MYKITHTEQTKPYTTINMDIDALAVYLYML